MCSSDLFESTDDDLISTLSQSSTSLTGESLAGSSTLNQQLLILFVPDGSATEATLDVVDEQNRFVRLSVRGLTGAVTVGGIQQRSSL